MIEGANAYVVESGLGVITQKKDRKGNKKLRVYDVHLYKGTHDYLVAEKDGDLSKEITVLKLDNVLGSRVYGYEASVEDRIGKWRILTVGDIAAIRATYTGLKYYGMDSERDKDLILKYRITSYLNNYYSETIWITNNFYHETELHCVQGQDGSEESHIEFLDQAYKFIESCFPSECKEATEKILNGD